MKQITDKKKCTGCQTCRLVCPVQCISIINDNEGFQCPHVDETRCINCNLCARRCPINNRPEIKRDEHIRILGARLKDDMLLSKSASGGVFAGLALKVLETPGNAVFGCAYDDDMVARHICVTDVADMSPLQSSKYVQSDVGDTYLQVKTILDSGHIVLYSGTPCQIAGLYAFLARDYDNLLTVEVICHGVPSPLLFKKYIEWLEGKYGGKVEHHSFRDKERDGWGLLTRMKIRTIRGSKNKTLEPQIDPYLNSFYHMYTFRESCYTCEYARSQRIADITLGDYWDIKKYHPEFYDFRGVSIVLTSSRKGEIFFKTAHNEFEVIETTFEKASAGNPNLYMPSNRPAQRDTIYLSIGDEANRIFNEGLFRIEAKGKIKYLIKQSVPLSFLKLYRHCKRIIKKKTNTRI